jgi:hypothetical protein
MNADRRLHTAATEAPCSRGEQELPTSLSICDIDRRDISYSAGRSKESRNRWSFRGFVEMTKTPDAVGPFLHELTRGRRPAKALLAVIAIPLLG